MVALSAAPWPQAGPQTSPCSNYPQVAPHRGPDYSVCLWRNYLQYMVFLDRILKHLVTLIKCKALHQHLRIRRRKYSNIDGMRWVEIG